MTTTADDLARFQRQRALVSVSRSAVDDHDIQGFVLAHSDSLVLLQYVYDFNLDGLMVLRTPDISEVRRSKTDEFQQGLLQVEGILARVPFGRSIDLSDWRSAIEDLRKDHPLLILERELLPEPDMSIGRVVELGAEEVRVRYFTGTANWRDELDRLRYEDLTCCQAGTNYINMYQRHFERSAGGDT